MAVKPVPEGYHTLTPSLTVRGAWKLIEFLKRSFEAELLQEPLMRPDGTIMWAGMKIGDSRIMLSDANEQIPPVCISLYVYVNDVDATYKRAIAAGGVPSMEPTDHFYGDRSGGLKDPFGNSWWIATHKEDVSAAELAKRADDFFKKMKNRAA